MAMTSAERLEAVFAEADERCRASRLPEPSIEEIVACCGTAGEGDTAMSKFVRLDERTAYLETPEEREAYLAAARELGDPELLEMAERTVGRAEAVCGGALRGYGDHIPGVDWSNVDYVKADSQTGEAVLPAEWDAPEDDGLYDEYLERVALERLAAHEGEPGIPASEVYAELGISAAEIEAMPDVELE